MRDWFVQPGCVRIDRTNYLWSEKRRTKILNVARAKRWTFKSNCEIGTTYFLKIDCCFWLKLFLLNVAEGVRKSHACIVYWYN